MATALILFFGGLIAWWQASEARRLRRAQTRPFVVIDFDALREHQFIYLEISNVGSTLARNVRFEFRRPIASSMDKEAVFGSLQMLSDGIPSLPPGKRISILFDSAVQRASSDLPDLYDVRVSYEGDEGKRWIGGSKARSYSDWTVLDLGIYANTRQITRRGMHDVHERLQEIKNLLSKWSATGGGLLALSPGDANRRFERWKEQQTQEDTSPDMDDETPPG